jgi:hypothetical protein
MVTTVLTPAGDHMLNQVVYGRSSDDGVGTHTTSSRYVPATKANKRGPFNRLFHGKKKNEDAEDED